MKQVTLYIIDSRTQIALIFKNIFKAASLSCYITLTIKVLELLNKNPPSSIKTFLKSHNKWIDSSYWKIQKDIFPVYKMHYLKPHIPELVNFEICFIFFRSWVICQNKRRHDFYTLTETRFIDNERSKTQWKSR